jgi:mRNA-degrading endonuclease toxin of MazEF toxin-antitoxin module
LADLPGNVQLSRQATDLPKASVANVYDVQKAFRADFLERVGTLPADSLARLDAGLRLVLDL